MAATNIAVEWRNQNSLRNFPFREDCGLRPNDSAGNLIEEGWRIPNYLITDLVIGVNAEDYDIDLYLKRMTLNNGTVSLAFADGDGTEAFVASSSISDTPKTMTGSGKYSNARGTVFFGDIESIFTEASDGVYSFSKSETLVEPTCIRPSAQGVSSICTEDISGYVTRQLQGDVKLVAGDNISIRYDEPNNALIISADPNSGYTLGCTCDQETQNVVKTINGLATEAVVITGDDCLDVTTSDGIIKITDRCSKPCCGCAETSFINQSINDLQSSVGTLENNVTVLSDRVTTFVNNYLLARKTLA